MLPRICGRKNSEKLAEYVAERKKVEKAQRMKEAFPAAVAIDFFFESFEVGEQVAVGEHDAAGFGGGAGGEDDFDGIGALDGRGGKFVDTLAVWRDMQAFEFDDGDAEIFRGSAGEFTADCGCADTGLARDAGGKFRVGDGVHRDGYGACEQAAEKCCEPFAGIFAPD